MKYLQRSIFAAACILFAAPSFAQTTTHGDWLVFNSKENGNIACVMSSEPKKSAGKYTKRGTIYAVIAHRPAEQRMGEFSFQAGYTFKKGADVSVVIDGKKNFNLFTDKGYAWAVGSDGDQALIKAMRAGNKMIVKGISTRGTKTTDTFSLKGFTAALKAINSTCKIK